MKDKIMFIAENLICRFHKILSSGDSVSFEAIITIAKCLPELKEIFEEKDIDESPAGKM